MSCQSCSSSKHPHQNQAQMSKAQHPSGFVFVTKEKREERLLVCYACPGEHLKVLKQDFVSMCKVCKCLVEPKTWIKGTSCPQGYWS